jgi:hypothetical protein
MLAVSCIVSYSHGLTSGWYLLDLFGDIFSCDLRKVKFKVAPEVHFHDAPLVQLHEVPDVPFRCTPVYSFLDFSGNAVPCVSDFRHSDPRPLGSATLSYSRYRTVFVYFIL